MSLTTEVHSNLIFPLNNVNYVTGTSSGTYTGSTTVFNLPFTYQTGGGGLLVFSSGLMMVPGAGNDYVETDNQTITFNSVRTVGEVIRFVRISS
jgi:hypothetical protein